MMHTAKSIFSNFVIEYLGENETEFENTSACLSETQMGSKHEKNWRSKISWHSPFKQKQQGANEHSALHWTLAIAYLNIFFIVCS